LVLLAMLLVLLLLPGCPVAAVPAPSTPAWLLLLLHGIAPAPLQGCPTPRRQAGRRTPGRCCGRLLLLLLLLLLPGRGHCCYHVDVSRAHW
jgi:hypothetical protein